MRIWSGSKPTNWRLALLSVVCCVGCDDPDLPTAPAPPPQVTVGRPVSREVVEAPVYTGRVEAVESVEIRARVSGYLQKIHYDPNKLVAKGDLLFEIDARPYQAALDAAQASIAAADARQKRAKADRDRAEPLVPKGTITRAEFDQIVADQLVAEAGVQLAKAQAEIARLNLQFTRVEAPIAGRAGRALITEGNLVAADSTLLTTLVSIAPIYAYFDVDEGTVLQAQQMIREGKMQSARETELAITMALATDAEFVHQGIVNFVDNRLDAGSGTLQLRAVFANTEQVLYPGLFARIKLPLGAPRSAVLVPERAVGVDQGQKFVYVVDAENKVEYRPVRVGDVESTADGELRVIEAGLGPDERVVVNGLQRVRPGVTVAVKEAASAAPPAVTPPPPPNPESAPAAEASR
jgi:RND family efflux transporter MFP subunit